LRRDPRPPTPSIAENDAPSEAGKEGLAFEMLAITAMQGMFVQVAERVQAQLREAGINVTLKPLDAPAVNGLQRGGNFQAYLSGFSNSAPNGALYRRYYTKGTENYAGYSNPELDKLIDQQAVIVKDVDARKRLLLDVQRKNISESAYQTLHIYLFWLPFTSAVL
jgi:peptide/nickel transport system substrate-binding protein